MSYYEFPAGTEGLVVTNPETGERYIFTNDAWQLYHGNHPDFVNRDGDSMTGRLELPAVWADSSIGLNEGLLTADSASSPDVDWNVPVAPVTGTTIERPEGVSVSRDGSKVLFWGGTSVGDKVSIDGGETFSDLDGRYDRTPSSNAYAGLIQNSGRIWRSYNKEVHISDDNGATWRHSNQGKDLDRAIYLIKDASWDEDIVIAAAQYSGMRTTTDGGLTWSDQLNFVNTKDVYGIVDDGSKMYVCSNGGGIWSWDPASDTWEEIILNSSLAQFDQLKLRNILYDGSKWYYTQYDYLFIGGPNITDPFTSNLERTPGSGQSKMGQIFAELGGSIIINQKEIYRTDDEGATWESLLNLDGFGPGNNGFAHNDKYLFFTGKRTGSDALSRADNPVGPSFPQGLYWNGDKLATVDQVKAGFEGFLDLIGDKDSNNTIDLGDTLEGYVKRAGDSMEGPLTVPDPTDVRDAIPLGYMLDITNPLEQNKVNKSGDSMEGDLELFRNPVRPMHAATKNYVDQSIFDALNDMDSTSEGLSGELFVKKAGDTMSGQLKAPSFRVLGEEENEATIFMGGPDSNDDFVPLTSKIGGVEWEDYLTSTLPKDGSVTGFTFGKDNTFEGGKWVQTNRSSTYSKGRTLVSYDGSRTYKTKDDNAWGNPPSLVSNNDNKLGAIKFMPEANGGAGRWIISTYDNPKWWTSDDNMFNWNLRGSLPQTASNRIIGRGIDYNPNNGYVLMVRQATDTNNGGLTGSACKGHFYLSKNWGNTFPEAAAILQHTEGFGWTNNTYNRASYAVKWTPHGGGRFVVAGEDLICYSDTGEKGTWFAPDGSAGGWNHPTRANKVKYKCLATDGRGTWLAQGGSNWKISYDNAETWAGAASLPEFQFGTGMPPGSDWADADYYDGWWIVVNNNNNASQPRFAISRDLFNWELGGYGFTQSLYLVDHGLDHRGNTMFVATKAGGEVMRIPLPEELPSGLFYNGDLLATEKNLQPLFDQVNLNTQLIGQLAGESDLGEIDLGSSVDSSEVIKIIDERIDSTQFTKLAGDTMTGFLTLHANPTEDLHAATKAFVTSAIIDAVDSATGAITIDSDMIRSTFVEVAGDTMTGFLSLHSDPASDSQAATKRYVDTQDASYDSDVRSFVVSHVDSELTTTLEDYRLKTDSDELNDLSNVKVPSPTVGDRLVWNGSEWVGEQSTAPHVYYQDVMPVGANNADMWFNTTTMKMSVWHENGWVQIGQ